VRGRGSCGGSGTEKAPAAARTVPIRCSLRCGGRSLHHLRATLTLRRRIRSTRGRNVGHDRAHRPGCGVSARTATYTRVAAAPQSGRANRRRRHTGSDTTVGTRMECRRLHPRRPLPHYHLRTASRPCLFRTLKGGRLPRAYSTPPWATAPADAGSARAGAARPAPCVGPPPRRPRPT